MRRLDTEKTARAINGRPTAGGSFSGVYIDSRKPVKDALFVCIEGDRFDGHAFVSQAEEAGAACIMARKHIYTSLPVIYVDDTKKALLALAGYYRSMFRIPVVGLTGSVGKTTTKDLTAIALGTKYRTLKTQGNLNNDIGVPITLFGMDEETEAAVVEMGMNHKGEISVLTGAVRPTCAIITNVGVAHIENLGSREGILSAKLEITEGLEPGAPLIINGDNDLLAGYDNPGYKIIRFGMESERLDVRASDVVTKPTGTEFVIGSGGKEYPVFIPAVGMHIVYDALSAFAAGVECGAEPEKIAAAFADYVPSGMRGRIVRHGGVTVVEDCYNSNPDSAEASLKALMLIPAERHIAVLGDMLELGEYSAEGHRRAGAAAVREGIDAVFAYGREAKYIAEAARAGNIEVYEFTEPEKLAAALAAELRAGDAVVFKASRGMALEDVIGMIYNE
ncbi:MAG: UDP-N-acetylmuramoyl-tripeptide--D-alanyl-D-alanine ligase [Clostridia bacterium]|nr:UDP-N-acetylmuramoyl-tripeptide--D-alanyl-D-alanine ligase [Clostridia bacterium]